METITRDLAPGQVISWLRSPAGESWSSGRIAPLERHQDDGGVLADLRTDDDGFLVTARWPEPFFPHDLDSDCAWFSA